jgi:ribosomal protein S18 acetylase RimI-like enzyme
MPLRSATRDDAPALLEMMREYYAEDGYPFVEAEARQALDAFLSDGRLGQGWIVVDSERPVGYAVLTMGYSLEYRGLDAFVDELFVRPSHRGRGLAKEALHALEEACRERGVRALHLEVEPTKDAAQGLYRRSGFRDHDRRLMTKLLG